MHARLTVPFADASAGQLGWGLFPAATSPLATIAVRFGTATLHLAVLGASHQVEARLDGASPCFESVTCEGGGLSPLPCAAERDLEGLHYRFSTVVERLCEAAFSARADALRARLAPDPQALVASFPGHADALTGVAARRHGPGVAWSTWHAYPATGELVRTSTWLAPR